MATNEQIVVVAPEYTNKEEIAPSTAQLGLTVITDEEIKRITELGLGRGVDATEHSPWSKKSPFQVRYVTSDSIITTDEGGALQTYEREIESLTTIQTNLKASVSAPSQVPIDLNLEGEFSRSVSSTRKAVGKQIINRTLSFRVDFDDVPQSAPTDSSDTNTGTIARDLYMLSIATPQKAHLAYTTFEKRLAGWIVERVVQREESECDSAHAHIDEGTDMPEIEGVDPIRDLAANS